MGKSDHHNAGVPHYAKQGGKSVRGASPSCELLTFNRGRYEVDLASLLTIDTQPGDRFTDHKGYVFSYVTHQRSERFNSVVVTVFWYTGPCMGQHTYMTAGTILKATRKERQ